MDIEDPIPLLHISKCHQSRRCHGWQRLLLPGWLPCRIGADFFVWKNAKSGSLKCHRLRLWIVTVLHLWPDKEIIATLSQCFTFDHCSDIPDFGDFGAQVFRDNFFPDPPGNISHPKAVGKMSFLSHFETHLPRSLTLCPWKVTEFPIGKGSWIIFQPLFFSDELLNFRGMFSSWLIFHQPRFLWNKGISLTKPPIWGPRSCFRSLTMQIRHYISFGSPKMNIQYPGITTLDLKYLRG